MFVCLHDNCIQLLIDGNVPHTGACVLVYVELLHACSVLC